MLSISCCIVSVALRPYQTTLEWMPAMIVAKRMFAYKLCQNRKSRYENMEIGKSTFLDDEM
ncbi:Uncharacterized protein APZ42_028485 [Daphnia magna]|uniref:Uncharacterized protein n=1 Tax=Daphnia magna TaxID=35525 RepID=A0A164QGM5_9CRUS|nr:Uncharacterized protein APZ42_028485 [Daphnia magna]